MVECILHCIIGFFLFQIGRLAIATLCDPRYKKEGFKDNATAALAIAKLKDEMALIQLEEPAVRAADPATARGSSSLWATFDSEVDSRAQGAPADNDEVIRAQVVKYLRMNNAPRTTEPIGWWISVGKELYPRIYEVAKKVLVIPATSVPSERVFSTAGEVLSKKRCSLADDNASALIFLKENSKSKRVRK